MWTFIIPFAIFFVIMYAASYIVVENGQNYLYDEVTPAVGLKVAGGTFLLALIMTLTRGQSMFDMVTNKVHWTLLLGVVGFLVYLFLYQFQPSHAAMIGIVTTLLVALLAGMAVDSLTQSHGVVEPAPYMRASEPLRRTLPTAKPVLKPGEKATTKAAPH